MISETEVAMTSSSVEVAVAKSKDVDVAVNAAVKLSIFLAEAREEGDCREQR